MKMAISWIRSTSDSSFVIYFLLCFHFWTGTEAAFCMSTINGAEYTGDVSTTRGGRTCQRWEAQNPHPHSVTIDMLPDTSWEEAGNFCRSPGFDSLGPWCYTTDSNVTWEYCRVPRCDEEVLVGCTDTEKGENYIGAQNQTASNQPCVPWTEMVFWTAFGYLNYDAVRFPDGNLNHAFCRNPLGQRDKLWCHTSDTEWGYCDVPLCEKENGLSYHDQFTLDDRRCHLQGGNCAEQKCCTNDHYVENLCADESMVCCMSKSDCNWQEIEDTLKWPEGDYGVPKTIFGCPDTKDFKWIQRKLRLDRHKGKTTNLWSPTFHLLGPYTESSLTINICERNTGFVEDDTRNIWPKGNYCLVQTKEKCPTGLAIKVFQIESDDVDISTTVIFDKVCDSNKSCLSLNLCCSEAVEEQEIRLPNTAPFFLLKAKDNSYCTNVRGMKVTEESFSFPVGASHIINGSLTSGIVLKNEVLEFNLCYYEPRDSPEEWCYDTTDRGFYYRGPVNVTHRGPCSSWSDMIKLSVDEKYDYVGLEGNQCTNVVLFQRDSKPWCYVHGLKVQCGIKECQYNWEGFETIGKGKPARQKTGGRDVAQLANDGALLTCSTQSITKAWWQVDLQGHFEVYAVQIFRYEVEPCVLRLFDVYVDKEENAFLHHGTVCAYNKTAGAADDGVVRCVQPVVGQYVTISNLVHMDSETIPPDYEKCLQICEVQAFVKDTGCGRLLMDDVLSNQITPYYRDSSGKEGRINSTSLYGPSLLCLSHNSEQIFFLVNLLFPRRMQGILVQGTRDGFRMITRFTVKYGLTEQYLIAYEEYPGKQHVFQLDKEITMAQRHMFIHEISGSILKIDVLEYHNEPCLRFDILGCNNNYVDLMRGTKATQSSDYNTHVASRAIDENVDTCADTNLEDSTWWKTGLEEELYIHTIVMKTGVAFGWNLAALRPSYAKSEAWYGYEWKANDGNPGTDYWLDGTCSHTFFHDHPWWMVDLQENRKITSVKVAHRIDCCESRGEIYFIGVTTNYTNQPDFDPRTMDVCLNHNEYIFPGIIEHKFCDKTMHGRFVAFVIPREQYLTLCEVMVFGERDPLEVRIEGEEDSHCIPAHDVLEGESVHSMLCTGNGSSLRVALPNSGPMSICTINAYGGQPAKLTRYGSQLVKIECYNSTVLHIQYGSIELSTDLVVFKSQLPFILDQCESRDSCMFRTETIDMSNYLGATPVRAFCSKVEPRGQKCQADIRQEMMIRTPNFPFYYGDSVFCKWTIKAPEGLFAALNVTYFRLAPHFEVIEDGCDLISQGQCQDEAMVYYDTNEANKESSSVMLSTPSLFISTGQELVLRFSACTRHLNHLSEDKFGIQAFAEFYGCAGCGVQTSGSNFQCLGETCGILVTRGYPQMYRPNEKMTWTIVVKEQTYIELKFTHFDVHEHPLSPCYADFVEVIDFDLLQNQIHLGRFCNSDTPKTIKSSWNKLRVQFISDYDIEATGFIANYRQLQYKLPDIFPWYGKSEECPYTWILYEGRCYQMFARSQPLSWLAAQSACEQEFASDLLSIRNKHDMVFIHFLLTNDWKTNETRTFIGLHDKNKEGYWRWSDGRPVTYSDWAVQTEGGREIRQPDGGDVEDCAMIRLDNLYSTRTWHDIPCSYNEVKQYICVKDVQIEGTLNSPIIETKDTSENVSIPDNLYMCSDGSFILSRHMCDGNVDCTDGSDESTCKIGNRIPEMSFRCEEGSIISLTGYCDFKQDCSDNSDEANCVHQICDPHVEWTCANGECIKISERCNLLTDCKDASDELACDNCNPDVAFQCFDGTCIPKMKRCDGIFDCPGSLHEDESEECIIDFIQPSCLDWKMKGYFESGRYSINPGGLGAFKVECNMKTSDGFVQTTIHHNGENRIYLTGYDNVGDYERHFEYYGVTNDSMAALKANSLYCRQYVKVECWGASGLMEDYWINTNGEKVSFSDTEGSCHCSLSRACSYNRTTCFCTESEVIIPRTMTLDDGYLTSTDELPIMAISLSGSGFQKLQYQYHTVGPLQCFQAGSYDLHRISCGDGTFVRDENRCLMDVDEYGQTAGCKDASHLTECEQYECPPMYRKCPNSYCIPPQMICDGRADCPMGEEEEECERLDCDGMFRCHGSLVCIEPKMVCDGKRQCQEGDDEQDCDLVCPENCTCFGKTLFCQNAGYTELPSISSKAIRKLDFAQNSILLLNSTFSGFHWLGELKISQNNLTSIPPKSFSELPNLFILDISFNNIVTLFRNTFYGLVNLKQLELVGNHLRSVSVGSFIGLVSLEHLHLPKMEVERIVEDNFVGLKSLKYLNISDGNVVNVDEKAFNSLRRLTTLDFSKNSIISISKSSFQALPSLERLIGDSFKYCCFVRGKVLEENCLPERDAFSSCDDLMRRDILKIFLWVLGLMAFLCNAFVIMWRIREKMNVYSFCVFNLAIADFFMGVYMVTLASVDLYYRGVYIEYAEQWQSSWLCTLLGFLNSLSSEASVFTLCLISADRFYKIVFPFQGSKFDIKKARKVTAIVWLFAIVIAALPLFPIKYFEGKFYARSSVCLSLHITNEITPGWEYSWAIFHGLNFTCFIFIFICYSYLYHVVKKSTKSTAKMAHGRPAASDISLARKLTLVVATDFICWVPINIIGVAAICGAEISSEVYAWVVVFALPINSAINPLLYTVSSLQGVQCCKKKNVENETKSTSFVSKDTDSGIEVNLILETSSGISVRELIQDRPSLSVSLCMEIAKRTAELLGVIHSRGQGVGKIDTTTVRIQNALNPEKINILLRVGSESLQHSDSLQLNDINEFGQFTKNLLRRVHLKDY